jgi:hypothetical protein
MESYKYLIIGGGLAGASAVEAFEKLTEMAQSCCWPRKSTLLITGRRSPNTFGSN